MTHAETFRLDKLYHQLLKPKNGTREQLPRLVEKLTESGFIEVLQGRYIETEKLSGKKYRKELFKLVQGIVNEKI